ncbi:MAG TPA: hypothetical protein DHN29_05775, partial [Cytophagales bacterium]|nr:hypothetical protein [Cytophagales bacterium]
EEVQRFFSEQEATEKPFQIPDHWVEATSTTLRYLHQNNALRAYRQGTVDVRYDPKTDRHVFCTWNYRNCIGAWGRSITGIQPKWLFFGTENFPLVVPKRGSFRNPENAEIGYLVEDAASACSVSALGDGISLNGTYLPHSYIPVLRRYEKIIIMLDPDAQDKSLEMQARVQFYTPCIVKWMAREPKEINFYGD